MSSTMKVKSEDSVVRAEWETAARRVLSQFGNQLPDLRLLCFLDNEEWQPFREYVGEANRGFYTPLKESTFAWPVWSDYILGHVFMDEPSCFPVRRAFDHVIYLHGSSCENEVGLTMTFAHELQHFVQYGSARKVWAENSLILRLPTHVIDALGLKWSDVPMEREARIVSKRVAERLFDAERVAQYIDGKIGQGVNAADATDRTVIRGCRRRFPAI
jgi:hypothetical protein